MNWPTAFVLMTLIIGLTTYICMIAIMRLHWAEINEAKSKRIEDKEQMK